MNKSIKNKIPLVIKQVAIKYLNDQQITNLFKTDLKKRALLSYIILPFKKKSLVHTNYFEAQAWARILSELGYNIDIINYRNSKRIDLSKYDIICGFGDVFQKCFERPSFKAKTIYYGTGMHVCHQNHITLQRVKNVYEKKGVWLGKSARFVEKTWTHQTTLVDGIIALGNNVCAESYRTYYNGTVLSVPAPFYKTQNANLILKNKTYSSNKSFLWFGSSGLIHKGLDLLLEYFSRNQDFTLHICGPVMKEKDFVKVYQKELFETKNIINHGFVSIEGDEFAKILEACSFVIFPSCSEGGAASVLTAIGNGGLIPLITRETTIDTGYEIYIETLDIEGINNAINKAINLSEEKLVYLAKKNLEYVLENHSQENYKNKLKLAIQNILGNNL